MSNRRAARDRRAPRSRWRGVWRAPFTPAAVALALFAVVGVAVLDDYGVEWDESMVRAIGQTAIDYVLGNAGALLTDNRYYYGATFEAPLILAERLLGLTDTRAIYLGRHLLIHLSFLTGGWFCYLLAWRLFGNRWLALFALLLFLLQPRIYAHSFFNSKDPIFLATFMLALYLAQRAFRRDTVTAFALCGVGVGVLVNLRIMGVMLFAAVPALRALDLAQARGGPERRRAMASAAAFVVAAAGTLYALSPYLWRDPFAIVDAFAVLTRHPIRPSSIFQGELVRWPFIPAHYLPTWMAITTPPAALLLCLAGAAAVVRRGLACPRRAAANTEVRFALLLLACLALPIMAVAALRPNIYGGWRHMYFLHAPLCLLAVYGLRALLAAGAAARRWPPGGGGLAMRNLLLAAAALAGMAVASVRLHPHQQTYFNFLVDRLTPERLRTQYQLDFYTTKYREGLQYLLARFPDETLSVNGTQRSVLRRNRDILPAAARERIVVRPRADFFIPTGPVTEPFGPVLHARRIYHNTLFQVIAVDLSRVDQATAAPYRAAYRAAAAGEPLVRSEFDLFLPETLDGRALTYVKEPCRPEDTGHRFLVRAVPADPDRLPPWLRERGWHALDFDFGEYGVRFDGRCLVRRRLPDYPVRALLVGDPGSGPEAVIDLLRSPPAAIGYVRTHAEIAAGERGAPAARAAFDLYLNPAGTMLTYYREPCAPADLRARFFLHLFPADAAELSAGHRPHGFHNRSFAWEEHGRVLDSGCVALVPLPAWERGIARIRTGQYVSGQGQLWQAESAGRAGADE